MRKVLALIIGNVLSLGFLAGVALAGVDDFAITSFEADYYLSKYNSNIAQLGTTEKIVAHFPEFDQNRGILRAISNRYKGHSLRTRDITVTDNKQKAIPFTTYTENGNLVLRIGYPDKYVHGEQTYIISYHQSDVIKFEPTHDELYWNTNGVYWMQPFDRVTARVHIPNNLSSFLQDRQVCYSGYQGSKLQECHITRNRSANETVVTVTKNNLLPQQNLTFVLGFDKGAFVPDPTPARLQKIGLAGLFMFPALTLTYMRRNWRKNGRDPKNADIVVPEYEAPKDMTPLYAGVILEEKFIPKTISAEILNLIIMGHLKLYEIEKKSFLKKKYSYELEKIKPITDLNTYQKEIVSAIFQDEVMRSRVKLDTALASKVSISAMRTKLSRELPKYMTKQGYFKSNPSTVRAKYYSLAFGMLFVGFLTMFWAFVLFLWGVGLMLSAIIIGAFASAMPARTVKGSETRLALLGLKDYMELAEADRIKFLQSPKGVRQFAQKIDNKSLVKLYEKLLPYAMLFGIEKDWAKQFADLYETPPDWYAGSRGFNATILANSLGNFSAQSTTSFAPPSSSGSSGFSSGGGFSGGGGGGGGGGGW